MHRRSYLGVPVFRTQRLMDPSASDCKNCKYVVFAYVVDAYSLSQARLASSASLRALPRRSFRAQRLELIRR